MKGSLDFGPLVDREVPGQEADSVLTWSPERNRLLHRTSDLVDTVDRLSIRVEGIPLRSGYSQVSRCHNHATRHPASRKSDHRDLLIRYQAHDPDRVQPIRDIVHSLGLVQFEIDRISELPEDTGPVDTLGSAAREVDDG